MTLAWIQDVADQDSTLVAATDSVDTIGRLGREVGETGRMLADGDFSLAANRIVDGTGDALVAFMPKVISAVFVLVFFWLIYRGSYSVLAKVLRKSSSVDKGLEILALTTVRITARVFILIMVMAQFGVNVTALLTGLSIVGLAVGLAARDTLENFIAGVTILADRPFRIGDFILVDNTFGLVEEITLRSTRMRTLNDEMMVMPNMLMINQKLVNHTLKPGIRVEVPFGIAYKEFPEEARKTVLALTEGDERLDPNRPPTVVVVSMNNSSVDMSLRFYLLDPKLEIPVRYEYLEKVREALRHADIEIPFPHLQLFIDGAEGLRGLESQPDAGNALPASFPVGGSPGIAPAGKSDAPGKTDG